ncbi:MAG TPA: HD domain-containing protein, partial [Anaerolineae bacterium]
HLYDVFEHTLHVLEELVRLQTQNYSEVANGEFLAELQMHFAQLVSAERTRGALLRIAALLHDVAKPATRSVDSEGVIHFYEHEARGAETCDAVMRRLRFSNDEIEIATRVIRYHLRPAQLARGGPTTNRAAYRFFRDASDAGIDTCVLALADWRGKAPAVDPEMDAAQRATNALLLDRYFRSPETVIAPPSLVDGRALMNELKIPPGPRVGELLEAIREAQAEGEIKTRDDALAFAKKIVSN